MTASRQVRRQMERRAAKAALAKTVAQCRATARHSRLQRQSEREKNGFYEGVRSVASSIAPSRSRLDSRRVVKGQFGGRILSTKVVGSREIQMHATKGQRSYRSRA